MSVFTEANRTPVACIVLPDRLDAMSHAGMCRDAEAAVAKAYEGRTARGLAMRPEITYPQLRYPMPIVPAFVYVAWRGEIRWAHQAATPCAQLAIEDLGNMDEALTSAMRVGEDYLWVFAQPLAVPRGIIPPAGSVPLIHGAIRRHTPIDATLPLWLIQH